MRLAKNQQRLMLVLPPAPHATEGAMYTGVTVLATIVAAGGGGAGGNTTLGGGAGGRVLANDADVATVPAARTMQVATTDELLMKRMPISLRWCRPMR